MKVTFTQEDIIILKDIKEALNQIGLGDIKGHAGKLLDIFNNSRLITEQAKFLTEEILNLKDKNLYSRLEKLINKMQNTVNPSWYDFPVGS